MIDHTASIIAFDRIGKGLFFQIIANEATFTNRRVSEMTPPDEVVPQPDVIVSAQPS